ncbi:MAG: ATP-binding protein, partial [Bacteroidota bacterium]
DALLVAELAAQHGLMLESLKVPEDWKKEIQQQGRTLQDAARRFRYQAVRELSAPGGKFAAAIVATAHHAMDQAETILLALLKGRNMQRLSGLQSNRELWRPWLETMPSELEAYARDKDIYFRHDTSNDSTAYDRNYLRNLVAH